MAGRRVKIAASILAADFARFGAECAAIEAAGADVLVAGAALFAGGAAAPADNIRRLKEAALT